MTAPEADPLTAHVLGNASAFDPFHRETEIAQSATVLPQTGADVTVQHYDEPELKRPSAIVEPGIRPRSFDGPEEF
jgi:hypothetical protein